MEEFNSGQSILKALQNEAELSNFYQRREFILQTAQQIQKDFAEFGIEIRFSGDTIGAYEELCEQMSNHLYHILNSRQSMLFNLLYRIDLSDSAIRKGADLKPDLPLSDLLADLIIQRELKKVLLRYYFKHQAQQSTE